MPSYPKNKDTFFSPTSKIEENKVPFGLQVKLFYLACPGISSQYDLFKTWTFGDVVES